MCEEQVICYTIYTEKNAASVSIIKQVTEGCQMFITVAEFNSAAQKVTSLKGDVGV